MSEIANELKYLKDYETSTDYEKFVELLEKGFTVIIEIDSITTLSDGSIINWRPISAARKLQTGEIALVFTWLIEDITKERIISFCKQYNLHYIMPKEK